MAFISIHRHQPDVEQQPPQDYFQHWLDVGRSGGDKMPRIYHVNWFKRDDQGRFIWPGFGENVRVLKWIFERLDGSAEGHKTAIGTLPADGALDTTGLDLSSEAWSALTKVDKQEWLAESEVSTGLLHPWMGDMALDRQIGCVSSGLRLGLNRPLYLTSPTRRHPATTRVWHRAEGTHLRHSRPPSLT